jgi:hypothetical protein
VACCGVFEWRVSGEWLDGRWACGRLRKNSVWSVFVVVLPATSCNAIWYLARQAADPLTPSEALNATMCTRVCVSGTCFLTREQHVHSIHFFCALLAILASIQHCHVLLRPTRRACTFTSGELPRHHEE